ncbi:MAG TPA: nucleotide exchange factor GrpE [Actinophytocola sp.]|uniref:nucleotide exchange factor GrpE n=1 Tax=Actinophytocola sp. TaxID=1872138 RepID=UPI002DDCD47B|nr:nucleotide exchange factor GrpE [Actinophytocola sp.]HEV2779049.1 nucleotide exchange factor GrpE [Actinophytocola sp.]
MPSWFKRTRSDEDQAESTIEVKAQVIADAVRAGNDSRGSVIAADGVIAGGDFEAGLTADEADLADGVDDDVVSQALAERKSLVQLCLYALDRARSSGVAERIEEGLAAVGVTALRPDGQRFDPAQHEAGGTVPTEDEALDGVVAETEVVGFSDRGDVLRAPIVTVYNRVQP